MTWGLWYWPKFLIISAIIIAAGFGPAELFAVFQRGSHVDNTLSYYARTQLNVTAQMTQHTVAWYLTLFVYLVIGLALLFHIWFDQVW